MLAGSKTLCRAVLFVCLALPGGVLAAAAAPAGYDRDTRSYNLAHGRVVFTENCMRCHEKGRKGAPIAGDPADWSGRIGQPLDVLIAHAIEGHGDMPARGETELSDQEIAAAVAYVVNRARVVLADQVNGMAPTGAGPDEPLGPESIDDAVVHMFLLLIGKDRWR